MTQIAAETICLNMAGILNSHNPEQNYVQAQS